MGQFSYITIWSKRRTYLEICPSCSSVLFHRNPLCDHFLVIFHRTAILGRHPKDPFAAPTGDGILSLLCFGPRPVGWFHTCCKIVIVENVREFVHIVSYVPIQGRFWHWFISEEVLRISLELISMCLSASVASVKFSKSSVFLLIYRFTRVLNILWECFKYAILHFLYNA